MNRLRLGLGILVLLVVLVTAWWLARPTDPASSIEGLWLAGDGETIRGGLRQVAALDGTPLATLALAAAERLDGCQMIVASLDELPGLDFPPPDPDESTLGLAAFFEGLRCRAAGEEPPDGLGDLLAANEVGAGASSSPVTLALTLGGATLVAILEPGETDTVWRLTATAPPKSVGLNPWLPASEGPGPGLFDTPTALVHARFVADRGLDLGAWKSEGEDDHIFNLRGDALANLLLGKTWELAMLPPRGSGEVPPLVVAVEVTSRRLAASAMDSVLRQGQEVWSWGTPVAVRLGEVEGECLEDLRLLPSLAPCWALVTRDSTSSLVLAWNRGALEQTLGGDSPPVTPLDLSSRRSHARVHLARLTAPERRPTRQGAVVDSPVWPWRELQLTGQREDRRYIYELRLIPRGDSGRVPARDSR